MKKLFSYMMVCGAMMTAVLGFTSCEDDLVFRLYYTSECEEQQTIDVYFEDNHDQLYQLTFTFNNEVKEEEDTTEGNTITPIGTIVSPININP